MNSRHHERRESRWDERASMRRHLELRVDHRLRRCGAETDDHTRPHERNFGIEPRATRCNLGRVWFLVDPALAARLPLEMLDDVGDVGLFAIYPGVFERIVEKLAGRTNKRFAGQIFFVARLLADKQDGRASRAFAENGLRAAFPEVASLAISGSGFERGEGRSRRNQIFCGAF